MLIPALSILILYLILVRKWLDPLPQWLLMHAIISCSLHVEWLAKTCFNWPHAHIPWKHVCLECVAVGSLYCCDMWLENLSLNCLYMHGYFGGFFVFFNSCLWLYPVIKSSVNLLGLKQGNFFFFVFEPNCVMRCFNFFAFLGCFDQQTRCGRKPRLPW